MYLPRTIIPKKEAKRINSSFPDIDECATMDCKGYECINSYGSYRCECDIGHRLEGDHCVGTCPKKKEKNISFNLTI